MGYSGLSLGMNPAYQTMSLGSIGPRPTPGPTSDSGGSDGTASCRSYGQRKGNHMSLRSSLTAVSIVAVVSVVPYRFADRIVSKHSPEEVTP